MKRQLFVLSSHRSDLRSALEKEYATSPGALAAPASRTSHYDRGHVLFVDATALDEAAILGDQSVKVALSNGIPLVIQRPTVGLLSGITGCGLDNVAACIIVQGKHRTHYCKIYMDATATRLQSSLAWSHEKVDDKDADARPEHQLLPAGSTGVTLMEPDLLTQIPEDLARVDQIEEVLAQQDAPQQSTALPANRRVTNYWYINAATALLQDPSGESNRTQTSRFDLTFTTDLIAADLPAKRKILSIRGGGAGFSPSTNGALIRNDENHRGWGQAIAMIVFDPMNTVFGVLEDFVPKNAANDSAVTAGFSWDLGFTAGSDGGSVSASFSKSTSYTFSSKDFKVLAETYGTRGGMRFLNKTYIVGGDTVVDARYFGFSDLVPQSGWTNDMGRMFYNHISGQRVRSWPSLSTELLTPRQECVWFAPSTETSSGLMYIRGGHGLNYFYKKTNWAGVVSRYCHTEWIERNISFWVNYNSVNYS